MNLSDVSTADLEAARVDLDHQIAALRERKREIARELEARLPGEEPESRVVSAPQVVTPGFVESESGVFSPGDPEPPKRRRWW